jgi:hypothetical protein
MLVVLARGEGAANGGADAYIEDGDTGTYKS